MDMYKSAKGTFDQDKALQNLKKISKQTIGVELPLKEGIIDEEIELKDLDNMSQEDVERLSFQERSRLLNQAIRAWRESPAAQTKSSTERFIKIANTIGGTRLSTDDLMETDTDYDRAKDAKRLGKRGEENIYGAGVKKGEEIAAKKMAAKRETIYEKYAQKYGVDVNDVKDRLEAYKLKQEEAIEVEDEATAISVQKKSPDADVRIIEK